MAVLHVNGDCGGSTDIKMAEELLSNDSDEVISEQDDEADILSIGDDKATKEFTAAFGFVQQQAQEKSKDDDQVDLKLRKMYSEFMRKQRRAVRMAHQNELLKKQEQNREADKENTYEEEEKVEGKADEVIENAS